MSKFVRVQLAPKHIREDEYVIHQPEFYPEILKCDAKRPRNGLLTTNYLREIVAAIGDKYVGETFNAMTDVNVSSYRGIPCDSNIDLNKLLTRIFAEQYPNMLKLVVEYQLKRRPSGIKLIYFTGDSKLTSVFLENGIDEILEKDLQPKQPVGKPAITNEEAAAIKSQEVDDSSASIVADQLVEETKSKKSSKKKTDDTVV